jgi:hypothetical protein
MKIREAALNPQAVFLTVKAMQVYIMSYLLLYIIMMEVDNAIYTILCCLYLPMEVRYALLTISSLLASLFSMSSTKLSCDIYVDRIRQLNG